MNSIFSQDTRLGQLHTVLGENALVLLRFSGSDHLNDLFEYEVDCLSKIPDIDFDAIIGTHASIKINSQSYGDRLYDGIVTEAKWRGFGENGTRYQLTLRPWFWLADQRRNQRIFHKMSVVSILKELLAPYARLGAPALQITLLDNYPELEYTVQYRESDMQFAMRLMERFGISFHFTHEMGGHTMVLTDDVASHPSVAGGTRDYKPYVGQHNAEAEHFWEWQPGRRLTTGAMRLTDYNFKRPRAAMEAERVGDARHAEGQIESYDYPGDYLSLGQGNDVVQLRMKAERGQDARHTAVGDCVSLGSGMRVTLTGDHIESVHGKGYLCLSATCSFVAESYGSLNDEAQGVSSDEYAYTGQYVLMPETAPMVPERKTPIPVVQGPQTATVVGEGEIDCDEFGRILVHFHWDLEKAYSMRCRVSQNWASKGWGGMVIPRIGMEVVVEFLEGDPDKPLVTGCVYNGANMPPYRLPEHKTRSTFKTDTHQGSGYNELRFEDEKDEEEIFLHAQKDHNTVILNNESHKIGNMRTKSVGVDQKERIGRDKEINVTRDHVETIGQDERKFVRRNAEREVTKDSFDYVNNHRVEYTYANHKEEVGANHYLKVEGNSDVIVGQKLFQRSQVQVLHAKDKFIIGGPGGTIEINGSGVVIRSPNIQLKGPVQVSSGAPDQIASLESAVNEGLDLAQICARKLTDE